MTDHPLLLLLFVMMNMVSAAGFGFVAAITVPRSQLSRRTRWIGVVAASSAAASHLVLAMVVLFEADTTAGEMSANVLALFLHAVLAGSLWMFLIRVWIEREAELSQARRRAALDRDDELHL